jgi:hypothetical protein
MINFDSIDRKSVTILCRYPEGSESLAVFLRQKGFAVSFEKLPGAFFQSISKSPPGIVMISHELNTKMGKVFPNFIYKKFKIPVLLFHEMAEKKEAPAALAVKNASAAVRSANSNSPEEIHEEIENLRESYKSSIQNVVSQLKKNDPLTSSSRLKDQEKVIQVLEKNLKLATNSLEEKKELNLLALKIIDPSGSGSFMFFTEVPEGECKVESQNALLKDIQAEGLPEMIIEPMDGTVGQELYQNLKLNSDKVIQGYCGEQAVIMLYFMNSEVSSLDEVTISEKGYFVPVKEWWVKMPLLFDAYLYFSHKERKLLYLRKGDSFRERNILKFSDQSRKILVDCEDFHSFEAMSQLAALAKVKI